MSAISHTLKSAPDEARRRSSPAPADPDPAFDQRRLVTILWQPFTLWVFILFAISYAAFYPGLLNADSVDQLSQSLAHQYRDWHSPLMSAVWSLLNRIHVGPAALLMLDQAAFYIAAFVFASVVFQRSLLKYAWLAALVFYPPVFNVLGLVTCDGFYVPIVFLGYALALKSLSSEPPTGRWLNVVSQALLIASIAVRREGLMAAAAALFVLDLNLLRGLLRPSQRSKPVTITLSLCLAGITLLIASVAIRAFNYGLIGARQTFPYQPTLLYDLTALSVDNNANYLPDAFNPSALTVADLENRFDPATGDSFLFDRTRVNPAFSYDAASVAQLRRTWRAEVTEHWSQYVENRFTFALYLLGIRMARLPRSQFISEQRTFGYFEDLHDVDAAFKPNVITRFYEHVAQVTFNWPIYLGWFYCLILLASLFVHSRILLVKDADTTMAMIGAALSAGALLQTALLFVAAPTPLFRYLDWPMLASILSLTLAIRLIADERTKGFRWVASRPTSKWSANSIA